MYAHPKAPPDSAPIAAPSFSGSRSGTPATEAAEARPKTDPDCPSTTLHGSAHSYRKHGCRCPEADADMVRYRAEDLRQARIRRGLPPEPEPRHTPMDCDRVFPDIHGVGTAGRHLLRSSARPACIDADPEWFFSPSPEDIQAAKAVCRVCPIVDDCLTHALRHEDYGVWGGLTAEERRALLTHRWAS